MKTQFRFSNDDLFMIVKIVEHLLNINLKNYKNKIAHIKNRLSFQLRVNMFRKLIAHMFFHDLWYIHEQYEKTLKNQKKNDESLKSCTSVYIRSLKLSCNYRIAKCIKIDQILKLHEIHSHWCYTKSKRFQINNVVDMNAYIDESLDIALEKINLINFDEKTLNVDEFAIIRKRNRSKNSKKKTTNVR